MQFHQGKTETDKAKINYMRRLAHEYSVMVSDIRESKHLRYLDTGEKLDPREKIELTARRVGLTVPQVCCRFTHAHIFLMKVIVYFEMLFYTQYMDDKKE